MLFLRCKTACLFHLAGNPPVVEDFVITPQAYEFHLVEAGTKVGVSLSRTSSHKDLE